MAVDKAKVEEYLETKAEAGQIKISASLKKVAIDKAMYRIAQGIKLPSLQRTLTITVTEGTVVYDIETGGSEFDRTDVITFQSADAGTKAVLNEEDNRAFEAYRRTASSNAGTPDRFTIWGNQIKYFPTKTGTITMDYLAKISSLNEIEEEYTALFESMAELEIYPPGSVQWLAVFKDIDQQFTSRKGQIEPYKKAMEGTAYRMQRVRDLNSL